MDTTELKVEGMSCGSCAASVSQALKRVPGVTDVQVDLVRGTARITAEQTGSHVPAFIEALARAGYGAACMFKPDQNGRV